MSREHICNLCGIRYRKKQALERHLATTTHDYSCSVCGAKFLKEKLRREHLKKVHDTEDDSKRCPICFKIFKTKYDFILTLYDFGDNNFVTKFDLCFDKKKGVQIQGKI